MSPPITEEDLHAWVDGELPSERRKLVEGWLTSRPEQRLRVQTWREQSAALHRAFDPLLSEPIPSRIMTVVRQPRPLPLASLQRLAAVVAWVALGSVIGFFLRGQTMAPSAEMASLPRQAAIAHAVFVPEVKHPVEVGADQETHLAAWLSKRLGGTLKPPHLDTAGYALVGGRLLAGENLSGGGAVAQFMYQDPQGKRLTLYVRNDAASKETAFRYAQEGNISVFYWVDGHFGYALSGDMPKNDLLQVATLVYRQLTP